MRSGELRVGLSVIYFDNTDKLKAPRDALVLMRLVGEA